MSAIDTSTSPTSIQEINSKSYTVATMFDNSGPRVNFQYSQAKKDYHQQIKQKLIKHADSITDSRDTWTRKDKNFCDYVSNICNGCGFTKKDGCGVRNDGFHYDCRPCSICNSTIEGVGLLPYPMRNACDYDRPTYPYHADCKKSESQYEFSVNVNCIPKSLNISQEVIDNLPIINKDLPDIHKYSIKNFGPRITVKDFENLTK